MTIREIIDLLRNQGHEITARERTDGGLRITSIDGVKYEGSRGNEVARNMTGARLSEARIKQLNVIIKGSSKKKKLQLSQEMKDEIKRIQAMYRKKTKLTGITGMPTRSNIRYTLKHYGEKEAWRRIQQSERYVKGLAYDDQIDWIKTYLKSLVIDRPKYLSKMEELINEIENKREILPEQIVEGILQYCYGWLEGAMNFDDFINASKTLLKQVK